MEGLEQVGVAVEPAVSLVWFIVGGAIAAVFVGGGFAELLKRTLLARLKARAEAEQEADRKDAEESGVHDLGKISKPWWWVALLGVVATVVGCLAVTVAAGPLGHSAALGALIGVGGGVNTSWLWNPVQRALKGVVGAVKGRFAGGDGGGS